MHTTGRRAAELTQHTTNVVLLGKMPACQMECVRLLVDTIIVRHAQTKTGPAVNWFAPKVSKPTSTIEVQGSVPASFVVQGKGRDANGHI